MSRHFSIDLIQAGYMVGSFSFMANAGFLVEIDVILGGGLGIGGLEVTEQEISGLSGSGSGLGFRVGALDAVCNLVTARLLPRLAVLGGGFGVLGKSPGNGLLLDPPLIYSFPYKSMSVGDLIAVCVRLVIKKSMVRRSIRESLA